MNQIINYGGHRFSLDDVRMLVPHKPDFDSYEVSLFDGSVFSVPFAKGYQMHKRLIKKS